MAGSTDLEIRQVPKSPFGSCVWLDTEDCHLEALDESMQYFDGLRYDLIAVDSGTSWNFSTPVVDKRTTTVQKSLGLARSNSESLKAIASDSAGEFCKAARQFDLDFLPSVPYRSTNNPVERIVQTFGDRRWNALCMQGQPNSFGLSQLVGQRLCPTFLCP